MRINKFIPSIIVTAFFFYSSFVNVLANEGMIVTENANSMLFDNDEEDYSTQMLSDESTIQSEVGEELLDSGNNSKEDIEKESDEITINNQYSVANSEAALKIFTDGGVVFAYEIIDDCSITITKWYGDSKDIILPDSINGYEITKIGEHSFESCEHITSIQLPKDITSIEAGAFARCTGLTSIIIPDKVTKIADHAFFECVNLYEVVLPDGITAIGNFAFYDDPIKSVYIPKSFKTFGDSAFGVDVENVFYCGASYEWLRLDLADWLDVGDKEVFFNCNRFEDENGRYIYSSDSKTSTLHELKSDKETVIIPLYLGNKKVARIGKRAFQKNASIKEVIFNDNIEEIDEKAFYGCRNLSSITLPKSIATIRNSAFSLCSRLKNVYYFGTADEWDDILIYDNNTYLLMATKQFNHGQNPVITKQPEDVSGKTGEVITFSVEADNAASFQWQYFNENTGTWKKIGENPTSQTAYQEGTTSNTVSIQITSGRRKFRYRCKLIGKDGSVLYSDQVHIVTITPKILNQPEDCFAGIGVNAVFHVDAENTESYEWYYSRNSGDTWNRSALASANTDTLSMKVSASNKINLYRCKLTSVDGTSVFTETVAINEMPAEIISQPNDVSASIGQKISFSVVAENVAEDGYVWQYSKDGVKWYKSAASGYNTDKVIFKVSASNSGNYYRCKITAIDGTVKYSEMVGIILI